MVKHNNIVPNVHFHKEWDRRVKLWFDQPAQKKARALKRLQKLKARFPRPLDSLKPIVRPGSIRHNHRTRLGRGFTVEELKVFYLFHLHAHHDTPSKKMKEVALHQTFTITFKLRTPFPHACT
jgi:hypothetical protein